jgi:hypothetical protein
MDTSALPYACLIATLSNREGGTQMDIKLENEELWALVNDAICLLETKEEEPGVERWLKQAESLMMARHRLGLHIGD